MQHCPCSNCTDPIIGDAAVLEFADLVMSKDGMGIGCSGISVDGAEACVDTGDAPAGVGAVALLIVS